MLRESARSDAEYRPAGGGGGAVLNAYCQEPICGPSRASLLTGTYPHTCNAFSHRKRSVLADVPTLGSVFRDAGYATASIGKVHIRGEEKEGRDLGFDHRALRYYTYDYRDYEDMVGVQNVDRYATHRKRKGQAFKNQGKYNPTNEPVTLEDGQLYDNIVTDLAVEFMEKRRSSPFFLWVGLEKPHPQWYAPKRFHDMYDPDDMALPETRLAEPANLPARYMYRSVRGRSAGLIRGYSEEQLRCCMAAYHANVSYMDMNVGRALDALERLGIKEKTIVIYTSDHGEMLMEHSLFQKHCMYEAAVGAPLVMACPDVIPKNLVKRSIVGLIDLFPTLLDMTGISHPSGLEGTSMIDLVRGPEEDESRVAFSEYYPGGGFAERMIREGRWKYIYTRGDLEQLYDLESDPSEMKNLAVEQERRAQCDAFRERVMQGWEIDEFDYDPE